MTQEIAAIRPSGRHLLTIGSNLIKDDYTAIIELVKNAYDADAQNVTISIEGRKNSILFSIRDDGHGMDYDTVINKWLVPSTDDKLKRKISPNKRIMQGRKGIGRYAAIILGPDLLLDTKTASGENTTIALDWSLFEKAEYLSDIEILVEKKNINNDSHYTEISVTGNEDTLRSWSETDSTGVSKKIKRLEFELKKLISPLYRDKDNDVFNITIKHKGLSTDLFIENTEVKIEPLPILNLYDYRIKGTVSSQKIDLIYENNKVSNVPERVTIDHFSNFDNTEMDIGTVTFDLKVYDRDNRDLLNLLGRGNKYYNINYTGLNEIKSILNDLSGVGVYRNGFRIRPLGDPGYDWLKLDQKRVQSPARKIGLNQIIGFIEIENEEKSHLEEKSARDGLKENDAYNYLLNMFDAVISELERRTYKYRRASDPKNRDTTSQLVAKIFDYTEVKTEIRQALVGVDENTTNDVLKIIEQEEANKNKTAEELVEKIAIYQGQATLGKIVNVILHEGRRPLNYFANQIDNFSYFTTKLSNEFSKEILQKIISMLKSFKENSYFLTSLFKRIEPLSSGRRGKRKKETLLSIIEGSVQVLEEPLKKHKIKLNINCDKNIELLCWKQDMYTALVNIIDNSIYWLQKTDNDSKTLDIKVSCEDGVVIDIIDNGLGIKQEDIESGIIFEPEYSTKEDGTGLGLALAGEACSRNDLGLYAIYKKDGAHLQIRTKDND